MARLTGERPMEGATPDSLLALHDAGYREVAARLGAGVVLDVGCGVGAQTARLARADRLVLGVDYSAPTVVETGRARRADPRLRFAGMDGAATSACATASIDAVVSSHIIEHFVNPVLHVGELARVLRPDGTAFVITPNAPADFENPFHVYLFEPAQLVSMLGLFFDEVECLGLEGDDVLQADFAGRRASGERILRLDPLELRRRIPRRAYVWSYERALPVVYRLLGSDTSGVGSGIDEEHLFITPTSRRRRRCSSRSHAARRATPRTEPATMSADPMRVWITVPTYQEVENIDLVLRRVRDAAPDATILVVDDSSPDGTADKAEALAAEIGDVHVLRRPRKMGLGSAYREGFAAGLARGYDVFVEIDADLSHDPADIPRLLARDRPRRRSRDRIALRRRRQRSALAPRAAAAARRRPTATPAWALGLEVRDATSGYRAYRADTLAPGRLRRFALDRIRLPRRDDPPRPGRRVARSSKCRSASPIACAVESKMSMAIVAEAVTSVTLWGARARLPGAGSRAG